MNRDWHRVRDRIKARWSTVEFDDKAMKQTRGGLKQMVSLIHHKTGEPRAEIRKKVAAAL
ncbi:general stress protein CsbD [Rubrivirga sp. S365]|nr:general stress protein CsbD [Rubrivirga sp. S365]MDT7855253.1 general stress protein CsbD [Rubrivirga sp. S365]